MRTSILVLVLAVAVVAWLPTSATAQSGDTLGACVVIGGFFADGAAPGSGSNGNLGIFDACIDGVDEGTCQSLCSFDVGSSPDDGGGFDKCFWEAEDVCTNQNIDWDGACEAKGCFLIASSIPGAAGELCEDFGATWTPGATDCGGAPVPALPKLAFAALALVLLAGTLMLLVLYGSRS